jgi:DNA polymerase I-like protein with 3'-5' exonuclease and polymerase domains
VADPDPSIYWSDNYVVIDFETSNILKGSALSEANSIVLACWERGDGTSGYHFGSEYDQSELVAACENADFIVAHNAKFELGWLRRCGVDLRRVVTFDTLLAEWVLGGNTYKLRMLGLGRCLERRGLEGKEGLVGLMIKAGFCPSQIPQSWLLKYCERDVTATHELFLLMRQELKDKGLEAVNYHRNLVTPCLADIEFNGLQLDEQQVTKLAGEMENEYNKLTSELQDFCGGAEPTSPAQLAGFVYGDLGFKVPLDHRRRPLLTPGGNPSVAAPVMEQLRPTNNRQRTFLDKYNEWSAYHSDVTKYLRKFGECCAENGGRLHGSINQGSTGTHRFSSSGLAYKVQFQNLNRRFKPLFCARNDGWLVGEADGAQLEFRVAVHLGRDKVGLSDIVGGVDIHSFTASVIGCSRQDAKAHTFKPLYGGFSGTPKEQEYYRAFAEKYSGVADTQRGWALKTLSTKRLDTEWGMKYYFPHTKLKESGWITGQTKIYNYPVQAFATAEIIPIVLVAMWHRSKDLDLFIVNTVHDSVIAEIPPHEKEIWHDLAKQCFIDDCYRIISKLYAVRLTVPLGTGVMVGSHWGNREAKESETVYNAGQEWWLDAAKREGMI